MDSANFTSAAKGFDPPRPGKHPVSPKSLPPLEVGRAYTASDFEKFEYFGAKLTGSRAILRLHLKNGTTIDLPATDASLKHLLVMLCDAFGKEAIDHLVDVRGWAARKE